MSFRLKGQGNSASNIEMQTLNDGGNDSKEKKWKKIFEPQEKFLKRWNTILLVSRVIALFLDPLFFYVPVINEDNKCIALDKRLWITAIVLRTIDDIIYLTNIVLQFRTAFKDDELLKQGKELNTDSKAIARRYLKTYFLSDFLAILPIPQVIISKEFSKSGGTKLLNSLVLFQYAPRVLQILISWKKLKTSYEKVNRALWVKAPLNLFLYILAGHALGACWYFFSTQRLVACWFITCENHNGCVQSSFNCDHRSAGNVSFFNDSCGTNTRLFDFGIFLEAVQSGILGSTNFPQKLFSGFWWGMRNLSSYGSNLQTSNYIWEKCFALCISIFGLLLFLYFIGNLQFYMLLKTSRSEELRLRMNSKKRTKQKEKIDLWCSKHVSQKKNNNTQTVLYADELKSSIMDDMTQRFEEDEDVYLENLLPNLPGELQKKVKQHICLKLLKDVEVLRDLNENILVRICHTLKPVFYNEHNFIVQEGDPIDAIFFITEGIAWAYTTSNKDEGTVPTHAERHVEGQFFGGELLEWFQKSTKASRNNLSKLPVSSKNLKTHTEVEAFALMASDLVKILSNSELWKLDPEQLEFEAASIVQRAWRKHQGSASRDPQNPAVAPDAVESKTASIFQQAWRRNQPKKDDSVGASGQ